MAWAAALGWLSLLHHDVHALAAVLIGHGGLDPGAHDPSVVLRDIDQLASADIRTVLLAAGAYALVRWVEACGLWRQRVWGEWLGALSGGLYIPYEISYLLHRPTLAATAVIVFNAVIVGYLGWRLWRGRT